MELLPLAIGIGLAVSLLFSEFFGVTPGGMVVPGYIALHLTNPVSVLLTLGAGFATFAVVYALSSVVILYGRRRTALMILVGYLVGMGVRALLGGYVEDPGPELSVIGYIIPGLIAIWLDRQGVVETTSTLLTVSVVVRLVLILVVGTDLRG
ncbi:MAG: poly-gamma-glutamate biosynthesis protein PgsC [Deltaproteobacteria bacterium]|nr:poly-gamma-glutamate biosynthesis protein PgsC [Deltaproteobacteria bacterium]